jgi:hypothetical protein
MTVAKWRYDQNTSTANSARPTTGMTILIVWVPKTHPDR